MFYTVDASETLFWFNLQGHSKAKDVHTVHTLYKKRGD